MTMFPALNQFRRIYTDNGKNDIDFSNQEIKLQQARLKVLNATTELVRSSERLNNAALRAFPVSLKPS